MDSKRQSRAVQRVKGEQWEGIATRWVLNSCITTGLSGLVCVVWPFHFSVDSWEGAACSLVLVSGSAGHRHSSQKSIFWLFLDKPPPSVVCYPVCPPPNHIVPSLLLCLSASHRVVRLVRFPAVV